MEENTWYDIFIELLQERYPKSSQLISELMNLLCIEREAAYRRVKKTVLFTVDEMAKIAAAWNISIDEIIGINSGVVPFQMFPFNYLNPTPKEFGNLQKRVRLLDHLKATPSSEYMEVCNKLPRPVSIGFHNLYRLEVFNWAYQYNNDESQKLFSKVVFSKKISEEFENYRKNIVHVKNTSFILDEMIFEYIVNNILYFHSILVITDEEKEIIKSELYAFLDYMMKIANNGCYPETQNKVDLYISQLCIDTNYSYYYTEKLKTCRIHAFGKFDITSLDAKMVANFREWMNLKKRAAIQISEVNEKRRIEYFSAQRKIVDSL